MKQKIYSLLLTALFGMTGMQVWAQALTTTEIEGVTYYEIGSAADLVAFAELVNGNAENEIPAQLEANGLLTADINMSGQESWIAIGDWGGVSGTSSAGYKGHFNGQGHAITGFNFTSTHNYYGLFGVIFGEALIENFTIEGTIRVTEDYQYAGGVAAYANNTPTIRNVHSKVNINNDSSHATGRMGGVLGASPAQNSKTILENCTYSGTFNVGEHTGNYGGIVGYILNNNTTVVDITNCLFDGTIKSEVGDAAQCGGIIGYTRKGIVTVKGCLSLGTIEFDEANASNIGQFVGRITYDSGTTGITFANNFYKDSGISVAGSSGGKGNGTAPAAATDTQFASGEVCYKLNGDQTAIGWYQTLGTDALPTRDATHGQVYMNGRKHCNGDLYDGVIYSNEETEVVQDEHDMVDGVCSYCGYFDEDAVAASMVLNADGFYEISNGAQLMWFAKYVNADNAEANAILTKDIDFSALTSKKPWTTPIGTSAKKFAGTFDGQGYKITGFTATSASDGGGLFGCTDGATIKNFSIDGSLTVTAGLGAGVIGYPFSSTITGIHSSLVIDVPVGSVHHVGGVVGSARGNNVIDRCSFSGSMTVAAGSTDNFAGVVAYLGGDEVTNCANYGTVTFKDAGCAAGGVAGYLNNTTSYVMNCLNIGMVFCEVSDTPKYGGAIIGRIKNNWNPDRVKNNYWLEESAYGPARKDDGTSPAAASGIGSSEDELASGEITWMLNEGKFIDIAWHQAIGEEPNDPYPVLSDNGPVVFEFGYGYENINESNLASLISDVTDEESVFLDDIDMAYQGLVDEYKAAIESWEDIETVEAFFDSYRKVLELKESIKTSANNYAAYVQVCEEAIEYLEENNLPGEWADLLRAYLDTEEAVEPNQDYPNGSYAYITENCNLDDEAIAEEIAFVGKMMENAIAGGTTAGTEITRLLVNPSFVGGSEGWTREADEGIAFARTGDSDPMPLVRGLGNGTFNVYQTLEGLSNGIYMVAANSMFRNATDYNARFHAGQLYLNGTANYIMSPSEDLIKEAKAVDLVNCYLEKDELIITDEGDEGYVPATLTGCSYAFNAGRYQNFSATEVTDGTLTVGVRSLGAGSDSDWMPFGNVRLWYLGTAEEANENLTKVLNSFTNRAKTIVISVNSDYVEDPDTYPIGQYPNMSESLKTQLNGVIAAAESAETGERKMALINTFSALFSEVYACRQAYIAMWNMANTAADYANMFADQGIISEEEYYDYEEKIEAAQDHYRDGDVSTEEALAIVEELSKLGQILPIEDGVYQLATAADLKLFSTVVNNNINGATAAKVVLTADIDMSGEEYFEPIGTTDNPYKGEFDGQGHKITGFGQHVEDATGDYYTLSFSGDRQGFFGYTKNATIQNFSIDGAFEYNSGTGVGLIGWAEGTTVRNVHSNLDIAIPVTSHHIGGICGDFRDSSKAYNCSFSGKITVTDSNTHDCVGGIGGYSNGGCLYENCANYGEISYTKASCYAGGILGYINATSLAGVKNCLNVGKIQMIGDSPTNGGAIIGTARSVNNATVVNNYWLEGSAHQVSGENEVPATIVTAEQLASGEVCYKLNGDQTAINWFQTLGEDEYPVLNDEHKIVYMVADGAYSNEKTTTPDGSKENPFVVKSAADLSNLINLLVSGRMNYVVMKEDVDMAGVTDWTPLFNIPDQSNGYPFIDFDGKGHVISNLTSKTEGAYDYCGLFGVLCGNVRNLGVENADVTCAGGTGIIAGYLGHSTYGQTCYVENVWVTGKLTASGYCGGLFGNVANESHITNCYANVEVNGSSDLTGGIIGRVRAKIEMNQVYAAGSINRGGGIIGGGQQDATPFGTYNRVAVWNNTESNFGPVREGEVLTSILYYDGTNFADMQNQVVAWDPEVWSCDMQPGSYPVLAAFDPDGIKGVTTGNSKQFTEIYNLAGQRLEKMQKGINIVNGKKILK